MSNTIPEEQRDYYAAYMGLHREMEKLLQENTQLRAAAEAPPLGSAAVPAASCSSSPMGSAAVSAAPSTEPPADTATSSDPSISSIKSIPSMESAASSPASPYGSVPVRVSPCSSIAFPPPPGDLPKLPAPTDIIQWAIIKAGIDLINLLLEKNRHYGASVFFPLHTFARASWREAIYVRLDDKLARLRSGQPDDHEDPRTDIAGYLVLEKAGLELEARGLLHAAGAPYALSASGGFCAASAPAPPTPSLDNIDTIKDLLIKAESDCAELRARAEKAESERDTLKEKFTGGHIAHIEDSLASHKYACETLKAERDALQARAAELEARIAAGVRVYGNFKESSDINAWSGGHGKIDTHTALLIDVQAVESKI